MRLRHIALTAFTLTVLMLGSIAILLAFEENYVLAAQFIILAAILDGFDGTLARLLRAETAFGERLDTYIDCISFGVAPAALTYQMMWKDYGAWGKAAALVIILSGVIRFSRGCSFPSKAHRHLFRGLPIPVSATWISVFVLIAEKDLLDLPGLPIDRGAATVFFWVFAFAFLLLQVSNVRYLKPSRRQLGIAMAVTLVAMLLTGHPTRAFCLTTAASVLYYVASGLRRHKELAAGAHEEEDEELPVAR
jgi:CDP-diacylglycerol--serine O-phosphatidyltransferase